jgi:hypothetical protein
VPDTLVRIVRRVPPGVQPQPPEARIRVPEVHTVRILWTRYAYNSVRVFVRIRQAYAAICDGDLRQVCTRVSVVRQHRPVPVCGRGIRIEAEPMPILPTGGERCGHGGKIRCGIADTHQAARVAAVE